MPRLVLKVDVDTFQGTLEGVPRLLDLFAKESIRATFFFSLGPDNTGKAVKRVFRKGFLKKVLRANPAASYGIKTMLYGTLLPPPDIGSRPEAIAQMRAAETAGHECGIHAWDHVDWHDRLPAMSRVEIEMIVRKTHERFERVFGRRATVSAAPGWTATPVSVELQEARGIRVTSDTRGGPAFYPLRSDGQPSSVLEIPSTLPTLDELLAWEEFAGPARTRTADFLARAVTGEAETVHVHSIHTEIEGGKALHGLFVEQIAAWKRDGVEFVTLGEAARLIETAKKPPSYPLQFGSLPGRATPVAMARR